MSAVRPLKYRNAITESPTIGVVWYQEVFIHTAATAVYSVGVGNSSSATRVSVIQNEGQFTVGNPTASASSGSVALTQINYQPTVNVAGAVLYVRSLLSCSADIDLNQDLTHRLQCFYRYGS